MNLREIIHAPTKPAWTARLVAYIALILTVVFLVQAIHVWVL